MLKALVTGENGFIGRHLVRTLRAEGAQVVTLGRREHSDRDHIRLNASEWLPNQLAEILEAVAPDVIFHLAGAARGNANELDRINVGLTRAILRGVEIAGLSPVVVGAGSAAEYGLGIEDGVPVREHTMCRPQSAYGVSKLAQTREMLSFGERTGVPVLVARIFNAIGPGLPRHLALGEFAHQIAASPRGARMHLLVGNLESRRDMIDVTHVAFILSRLARNPDARGIINVCSGVAPKLQSLVDILIAESGRDVAVDVDPGRLRSGELAVIVGSIDRLSKLRCEPPPQDFASVVKDIWRFVEYRSSASS